MGSLGRRLAAQLSLFQREDKASGIADAFLAAVRSAVEWAWRHARFGLGGWPGFTKKQQSESINAARFGGIVMVHRTDIAGWVGRGMGKVKPRADGLCCHSPIGALTEKIDLPRASADSRFGGKPCSKPPRTAIPSVHPIDVASRVPIKLGATRPGPTDPWSNEAWTSRPDHHDDAVQ